MAFKLRYETGIAATIQFIVITALNFLNGASDTVRQCTTPNSTTSCFGNILTNSIFFMMITVAFGVLWLIGFAAQDRRSKRIAKLLIAGELLLCLVGLFDLKYNKGAVIGEIVSVVEIISSLWVAWLAFRLMLAKGGRVKPIRIHKHHKTQS
jgi:hypothetical protein